MWEADRGPFEVVISGEASFIPRPGSMAIDEQWNNKKAYLRISINIRHFEPNNNYASSPDISIPAHQPITKHHIPNQWPLRSLPVT
jgi:hypothetical protein